MEKQMDLERRLGGSNKRGNDDIVSEVSDIEVLSRYS